MKTIEASYDGKRIILPPDLPSFPEGKVLVVFELDIADESEERDLDAFTLHAMALAWDEEADSVYDSR